MSNIGTNDRLRGDLLSPVRLFLVLLIVICGVELLIMTVLPLFAPNPLWMHHTFADPFLLTLLSAPFFWRLVVSPLRKALQAQKAKVETVLENVVDATIIYDQRGVIDSFNTAAVTIFGHGSGEAIGKHVALLFAETDIAAEVVFGDRCGSKLMRRGVMGRRKDGSVFPMDVSVSGVLLDERLMYIAILRDVTDQHRVQTLLAEEKEFSQSLIHNSAVPTFVLDSRHMVLLWNRACEELTGVKGADVIGTDEAWKAFFDYKRPLLADLVIDGSEEEFASLYPIHSKSAFIPDGLMAEGWYSNLNGRKRYINFNAAPLRNGNGELVAVIETLEDITERKQAAEKLEESEHRLKAILSTAVDAIITIDERGIIESANRACERLFGYKAEELVGRNVSMLMLSPYREEHDRYLSNYLETGEKRVIDSRRETVARHKDGSAIPVELAVSEVCVGKRRFFTGIISDITERKRREEEMAQALSLLNATLEATADGIMVTDIDGRIVAYNRQFVEMWQIPEPVLHAGEEETALQLALQQLKHPAEYAAHVRWQYEQPDAASSFVFEFKDGRIFERHSKPQRIGDTIVGRVRSYHDLTEQKRLENQLRHSQKMEAIGTLAGGVAHDFNNILTAIIGYGSLMQMRIENDSPLARPVEQILLAADRATALTQSLLTYSRKQTLFPEPVDLNEIVTRNEDFLSRLIGEDVELRTSLTDGRLVVLADRGQIEQITMNLATNARDAMPEGGSLVITTTVEEVDEDFIRNHGYGQEGRYACLSISDTGEGIDAETKERIFEPFFSTKEVGRGTGLGLSIVYGIVKQHNGFINVYSERGFGTTFRIYFPLTQDVTVEAAGTVPSRNRGGSETILLVEDNEEIRNLMQEVLTNAGYRIVAAVDGEEAVLKFREYIADVQLLILDVIMPKKNGKEVHDEIRRMRPDIKAIFTSGYTADIISNKGLCDSAVNFISKPLSPNKLLAKIREVLENNHES